MAVSKDLITKIVLKGQTDPSLKQAFQNASKIADSGMYNLKKFGETASKVMKVAATAAGTGMIASAKAAIDYESAFAGVMKTVDETSTTTYEDISNSIRQMSKEMPAAATQIADVAGMAGQLGISADNLSGFTEVMINLGETTNLSSEEAATAIAKLFNITGTNMDKVGNFGSTLVALGNNAATTENDIMNMASRIAAAGNQIGLSEQEILALSTSLSSVGMEAEAGGSAMSTVMTKIDKAVATSDDTLSTWAKTAGMSTSQFKKAWESDAYGAMQKVIAGMGDVNKSGGNLNLLLEDLDIKGLREADTMKRLAGASELMGEMTNIANDAWNKNTALTDEAKVRYETLSAKIQIFKNIVTDAAITFGNKLTPYISAAVDKLSQVDFEGMAQKFGNALQWIADHSDTLVTILGMVAGAFAAFKILGFVKGIMTAISVIKSFISAFGLIGTIMSVVGGPITLVVVAIGALVGGFVALWMKSEKFRNFWIGLWNGIKSVTATVVNALKTFFTVTIPAAFNAAVTKVQEFAGKIKNFFTVTIPAAFDRFVAGVVNIKNKIVNFFTVTIPAAFNAFVAKVASIVNTVVYHFKRIPYYIGYAAGVIASKIVAIAQKLWNFATVTVPQFIGKVANWFAQLPGKIWTWLVNAYNKVVQWGSNIIRAGVAKGRQFITSVVNFFRQLPGKVWTWLVNTAQKVVAWGARMVSVGRQKAQQFLTTVVNFFRQLPGKIWTWLVNTANKVMQWGAQLAAKGRAAGQKLLTAIVNKAKEIPGKMAAAGKDIVKGLWNGITGAASWLTGKIKGFVKGVVKGFKDGFDINSPSVVMADKIGKFLPQGVGVGIMDNAKYALDAVKKMGSKVIATAAQISPEIGVKTASLSNIKFNSPVQATANGGANFKPKSMNNASRSTNSNTINFTFAPVINGGNAEENRQMLKDEQKAFEKQMNAWLKKNGRFAF